MSVIYNKLKDLEKIQDEQEVFEELEGDAEDGLPVTETAERHRREKKSNFLRVILVGGAIFVLALTVSVVTIYIRGRTTPKTASVNKRLPAALPPKREKKPAPAVAKKRAPKAAPAAKVTKQAKSAAKSVAVAGKESKKPAVREKKKKTGAGKAHKPVVRKVPKDTAPQSSVVAMRQVKQRGPGEQASPPAGYGDADKRMELNSRAWVKKAPQEAAPPTVNAEEQAASKGGYQQFIPAIGQDGPPWKRLKVQRAGKAGRAVSKSGGAPRAVGAATAKEAPKKKAPDRKEASLGARHVPVSPSIKTKAVAQKKAPEKQVVPAKAQSAPTTPAVKKKTVSVKKASPSAAVPAKEKAPVAKARKSGQEVKKAASSAKSVASSKKRSSDNSSAKRPSKRAGKSKSAAVKSAARTYKDKRVAFKKAGGPADLFKQRGERSSRKKVKPPREEPKKELTALEVGERYYKANKLDKAIRAYKKALGQDPELVEAYNNLGVIYTRKGWFKSALKNFKKAIKANPYYADAHFNLAVLLEKKEDNKRALIHYLKFIEYAQPKHRQIVEKVQQHISFDY